MYIWLKDGAEKKLHKLSEQGLLGKVQVSADTISGKKYISVYGDLMDPTTSFPEIPDEIVEKVTVKERIHRGLRAEGLYTKGDATLLISTDVRVHSEMMAPTIEREVWQEVSASAPNIKLLKEIYTLVRQGKIKPTEDWEDGSIPLDRILSSEYIEGL